MIFYGHGSWIVVVVFVGMAVLRMVTAQRRRGQGYGRPPGPRASFTRESPHGPPTPPNGQGGIVEPSPGDNSTSSGTAPGWFADPFFKHQHRYWSGTEWTEHVDDGGTPGTDPPPPDPGRRLND